MSTADDLAPGPARMADGRVLRARGQRTRARLLRAGATVLARKGYHAARVDDIVAAAHSSHGTFYLYFASKEDLFEQLVAEVAAELGALMVELPVIADSDEGRQDLRAWLDRFADFYERSGPVICSWTETELFSDSIGEHGEAVLALMTTAMARNIRPPRRSKLDPTITGLALMMMVERLNYYATTRQVVVTRDEMLDTLVDVITSALFA
jgi:AcrR family transcriptional regulator